MNVRGWWAAFVTGCAACATQPAAAPSAPQAASPAPADAANAPPTSSATPKISVGPAKVESPRLEPPVIQKVVRDGYSAIRACYEAGLGRDPKLEGRVLTRFVIEPDGTVSSTTDSGSDLPDAEVRTCIQDAFLHLRFPEFQGTKVTVVYPIRLEPEKK